MATEIDRNLVADMAHDILHHTQSEEGGKLTDEIAELFVGRQKGATLGAVFVAMVAIFNSMDESLRRPAAVAVTGLLSDAIDRMDRN